MEEKGRYDYSLVAKDYPDGVKSYYVIRIICPIHGIYKQKYDSHVRGHGCPTCGGTERKWTLKTCIEDALKYKTRGEWQKKSSGYYAAQRNNWSDQCCKHMKGYINWTVELCKENALNYKTKKEWQKKSSGAYQSAYRNNWLDQCCKHMKEGKKHKGYWTLETCKEDALKYKTRGEWQKKSGSAYTTARNNGWSDQCCKHMSSPVEAIGGNS